MSVLQTGWHRRWFLPSPINDEDDRNRNQRGNAEQDEKCECEHDEIGPDELGKSRYGQKHLTRYIWNFSVMFHGIIPSNPRVCWGAGHLFRASRSRAANQGGNNE